MNNFGVKYAKFGVFANPVQNLQKCNESPGLTISLCTVLAETHSPVIEELYYSSYTEKMML